MKTKHEDKRVPICVFVCAICVPLGGLSPAWVAGGSKGIVENAAEFARELMETHVPNPLPPEVDRELDRILKAVEKEKLGM